MKIAKPCKFVSQEMGLLFGYFQSGDIKSIFYKIFRRLTGSSADLKYLSALTEHGKLNDIAIEFGWITRSRYLIILNNILKPVFIFQNYRFRRHLNSLAI